MRKRIVEAWRESQARSGSNAYVLKSAIVQKAEAWLGVGLLLVGFTMQIAGNLHGAVSANELGWTRSWWHFTAILGLTSLIGVVTEPASLRPALDRAKRANAEGRPYLLDLNIERGGVGSQSTWHPGYSIAAQRTRRG
jgi:hypothetical protein